MYPWNADNITKFDFLIKLRKRQDMWRRRRYGFNAYAQLYIVRGAATSGGRFLCFYVESREKDHEYITNRTADYWICTENVLVLLFGPSGPNR